MAVTSTWLRFSAEGERAIRACSRLEMLVGQLRRQASLVRSTSRREGHLADINEVAIVRGWSILESYLSVRADAVLQRDVPLPTPSKPIHDQVRAGLLDRWETWARLQAFWQEGLGLQGSRWGKVPEYKELRNLIAHGYGYVRPRPGRQPSKALASRLSAARLSPRSYAGRVPLKDADADGLIKLVREIVSWAEVSVP